MKTVRDEKGFTLVEIAIVLVIIGLLIGGVLKGQELIKNARIKKVYNAQSEITAAVYSYQDRYSKIPGDDNKAENRWRSAKNGNGDGRISGFSGNCNSGSTNETCQAWQHMRLAGLIPGDSNSALNPENTYGGKVVIGYTTVQGLTAHWVGMSNITYDTAQILDDKYDDGNYKTGSIRGSGNYGGATSGTYWVYFKF